MSSDYFPHGTVRTLTLDPGDYMLAVDSPVAVLAELSDHTPHWPFNLLEVGANICTWDACRLLSEGPHNMLCPY